MSRWTPLPYTNPYTSEDHARIGERLREWEAAQAAKYKVLEMLPDEWKRLMKAARDESSWFHAMFLSVSTQWIKKNAGTPTTDPAVQARRINELRLLFAETHKRYLARAAQKAWLKHVRDRRKHRR